MPTECQSQRDGNGRRRGPPRVVWYIARPKKNPRRSRGGRMYYVPLILAASGAMRCGAERRWSTRLVYARLEEAQAREGLPGVRGSTESEWWVWWLLFFLVARCWLSGLSVDRGGRGHHSWAAIGRHPHLPYLPRVRVEGNGKGKVLGTHGMEGGEGGAEEGGAGQRETREEGV